MQTGFVLTTALSLFIETGGLFIFDANTIHKHKNILADSTYVYEYDDVFCAWQNFPEKDNVIEIQLDFFEKCKDGKYIRSSETFAERAYTQDEFAEIGRKAGFELIGAYTADTFREAETNAERVVYVMENMTVHQTYNEKNN